MPVDQKKDEVLKRLLARTLEKKLKWKVDADESSYSVVLNSSHLVRTAWPNETAFVYVLNPEGLELFRFSEGLEDSSNGVVSLWVAAKESALGIEESLDDILKDLA